MTKRKDPKDKKKTGPKPVNSNPDALMKKINEYFDFCDNRIQQVYSPKAEAVIEVINPAPYTVPGLAYACGYSCRQTLYDQSDPVIADIIKRALLRIEADHNEKMIEKGVAGALFALKNHWGYVDAINHEMTGKDGGAIKIKWT